MLATESSTREYVKQRRSPIAERVPENELQASLPASARVMEIEISEPLPIISAIDESSGLRYQNVICLIRFHTHP